LDNGILSCDDPQRLQRICNGLSAAKIDALLRKWLARLPHPFTAADRAERRSRPEPEPRIVCRVAQHDCPAEPGRPARGKAALKQPGGNALPPVGLQHRNWRQPNSDRPAADTGLKATWPTTAPSASATSDTSRCLAARSRLNKRASASRREAGGV